MVSRELHAQLKEHPVMQAINQISQQVETPIYLVGGAVRDLLLDIPPEKDFDFVMEDNLIKAARLFSGIFSGSLFPLSADPPNYRVVFFHHDQRTEADFSGFRGDDLYQDLTNRDFTVNAIALSTTELFQKEEIQFYDPLGGTEDLKKRVLRLASPSSFDQDPLRILRAVRIAKERNFNIEPETSESIHRQKNRLASVSPERVRSEFFKTMSFINARESLELLDNLGLLGLLIPEVEILKIKDSGAAPGRSLWEHSLDVLKLCEIFLEHIPEIFSDFQESLRVHFEEEIEADITRRSLLKLAGFLHECDENEYLPPGQKGINVVDKINRRFKLGKRAGKNFKKMVQYHHRILHLLTIEKPNPRVYFQFFRDMGPEGLELIFISWADYVASDPARGNGPDALGFRSLINKLVRYYFQEFPGTSPLMSGQDIIERFGLTEGKVIGDLLKQVAGAEARGFLSSRDEALDYVAKVLGHRDKVIAT